MAHHKVRCAFCRGRHCNRCGPSAFLNQKPPGPIDGLHSNWVTGDVLACQRPSSRIIKEFDLIGQFRRHRIDAIVNLQEAKEHPYCGDGNQSSGFSYHPEEFMDKNIMYYNFPWEDMLTPTLAQMLNIVKVMSMSVQSDNKIAVHCHAGFGRTGIVIACFLLYFRKMSPAEAVRAVRTQRGSCIEKKAQLEYVYNFAKYIKGLQIVFAIHTDKSPFTIAEYLTKSQFEYLHGEESRTLRWLPKVVLVLCSLLNEMASHNAELLGYAFSYVLHRHQWEQSEVARVMQVKEELNKMRDWEKLKQENPRVLVHLLVDWLKHLQMALFPDALLYEMIRISALSVRCNEKQKKSKSFYHKNPARSKNGTARASTAAQAPAAATRGGAKPKKRLAISTAEEHLVAALPAERGKGFDVPATPGNQTAARAAGGTRSASSVGAGRGASKEGSKAEESNDDDAKHPAMQPRRLPPLDERRGGGMRSGAASKTMDQPVKGPAASVPSPSPSSPSSPGARPPPPQEVLTLAECGQRMVKLLSEDTRDTVVCVMKVARKLAKCTMYTDVLDALASSFTRRDFTAPGMDTPRNMQGLAGAFPITTPKNCKSFSQSHSSCSSGQLRVASIKLRRQLRLVFRCMSMATASLEVPQIEAFPIEEAPDNTSESVGEEAQKQMMNDICTLYRKLPLAKKNKVLSVLAEMYSKALEVKQAAFERPSKSVK